MGRSKVCTNSKHVMHPIMCKSSDKQPVTKGCRRRLIFFVIPSQDVMLRNSEKQAFLRPTWYQPSRKIPCSTSNAPTPSNPFAASLTIADDTVFQETCLRHC